MGSGYKKEIETLIDAEYFSIFSPDPVSAEGGNSSSFRATGIENLAGQLGITYGIGTRANDSKISKLEISDHGGGCGKDKFTKENIDKFKSLIENSMTKGGNIYFDGCQTNTWAKYFSKLYPDMTFEGNKNLVGGPWFIGPLWGGSFGELPKGKETYKGGNLK